MNKCIIIPDSFKGTLSARSVCEIMKQSVLSFYPDCEVVAIPIADGGEGTVDCFLHATNAVKVTVDVTGPFGEPITASYARLNNTAVLEMASVAGLPLVENHPNPRKATTYGVGLLMKHAISHGCSEIVLGLGGSCTNDGGVGAALALGTKFYDKDGTAFTPHADTLTEIAHIDNTITEQLLTNCHITAMCDIDNPMYGPEGAAHIFAPQKGADAQTVLLLDKNLMSLSDALIRCLHKDVSKLPGAGAAGALGAGVSAFFGGKLKSGIETILDLISFDDMLENTDFVFTGEGRIDSQSLRGKVVIGVASRCKKANVPVVVVAGSVGDSIEAAYEMGVGAIFSINRSAVDYEVARHYSQKSLRATMDDMIRFYKIVHSPTA